MLKPLLLCQWRTGERRLAWRRGKAAVVDWAGELGGLVPFIAGIIRNRVAKPLCSPRGAPDRVEYLHDAAAGCLRLALTHAIS